MNEPMILGFEEKRGQIAHDRECCARRQRMRVFAQPFLDQNQVMQGWKSW